MPREAAQESLQPPFSVPRREETKPARRREARPRPGANRMDDTQHKDGRERGAWRRYEIAYSRVSREHGHGESADEAAVEETERAATSFTIVPPTKREKSLRNSLAAVQQPRSGVRRGPR